jgi:hypothetical protein
MKRHLEDMAKELAERDNISWDDAMDNIMEEAEEVEDGYSFEEKDEDQ